MILLYQRYLFLIILACLICQRPCVEGADIPSTIFSFPPVVPNSTEKFVALTFDDGPHTTLTPKLLDSLQKLNAKVTFFVMGVKLASRAAVLQRAVLEGHEIANHAWNHPVMTKIPFEEVKYQLELTNEAIYNATGKKPLVMRPPYGNTNRKLNQRIYDATRLPSIIWSLDTIDWKRPPSEEIVKRAVSKAVGGTIFLCHDIHPGTVEAIPILVGQLQQKGFVFKTVSELIKIHYGNRK